MKSVYSGQKSSSAAVSPFKRVRKPAEPFERVNKATFIGFVVMICFLSLPVLWATTKEYIGLSPLIDVERHFSLIQNWRKMVNLDRHEKEISCLDGLRTIAIGAVLLGHLIVQGRDKRSQ